ncbi:hypothetical protein CPJCM30710_25340 [Clostridium polyendosporum]|uniref:Uncharacterized protein n=1 Tax=Clostridium polyendosporum TaxID=69208 RepID=A0A919VMS3_9CLOT|nr:hypothetical protein [Clostridium polyendosporum]GIM29868.1 hypothetical protein CPJCM30710_25340 [Clostridium polyendosporum]
MSSLAMKGLIAGFNAQIKALNENNLKVYDADNPDYFITGIEYREDEDKLIFSTQEDPEEYLKMIKSEGDN